MSGVSDKALEVINLMQEFVDENYGIVGVFRWGEVPEGINPQYDYETMTKDFASTKKGKKTYEPIFITMAIADVGTILILQRSNGERIGTVMLRTDDIGQLLLSAVHNKLSEGSDDDDENSDE